MISSARPAYRAIRRKLLISCASVAIATAAVTPQKVRAQAGAFQGTPSTTAGSVDYSRGAGVETITVSTPTASIDWSPYDNQTATANPIDFLPSGNTATFTSSTGVLDYTVLNRIIPLNSGRAIELNGTVLSTLQGTSTAGGRIWFYSPGGILIGSTAVFDVGSLLLTTADPSSWSPTANGFTGTFGEGGVVAAASSTSKIQVLAGAQIKALQQGSYIALIAPRIEQGGNVRVNGSAAYIAGEAMTMTFTQGLFDVQVDVGTDDPNGIVHTGTTGGPANQAAADHHGIYMAAVPKNEAMTMLLGGNVGFDEAVMGHLGMQPQSVHAYGGFRVQGRARIRHREMARQARVLEELGAFAVVLECIPSALAREITELLRIPTIGIGAGSGCDGQILVLQDLLGLNADFRPKFARPFVDGARCVVDAVVGSMWR